MSNRNDRLFQRIELFEKLSLYGSRAAFLGSIAQALPQAANPLSPQGQQLLSRLIDNVAAIPSSAPYLQPLQAALDDPMHADMGALTDAVKAIADQFAAAGPARVGQTQIAQELLGQLMGSPAPAAETGKPTTVEAPKAPGVVRIDPEVQGLLSQFMTDSHLGMPLPKIDGIITPNGPTRWALNKVKQVLKNPNMSDNEVFSLLKMPGKMQQMVANIQNKAPETQEAGNRAQRDFG